MERWGLGITVRDALLRVYVHVRTLATGHCAHNRLQPGVPLGMAPSHSGRWTQTSHHRRPHTRRISSGAHTRGVCSRRAYARRKRRSAQRQCVVNRWGHELLRDSRTTTRTYWRRLVASLQHSHCARASSHLYTARAVLHASIAAGLAQPYLYQRVRMDLHSAYAVPRTARQTQAQKTERSTCVYWRGNA